jgi:hypothetical protein
MNSRRERTGLESTGCMVAFIPGGVEQAVGPLVPYCAGPQVDPPRERVPHAEDLWVGDVGDLSSRRTVSKTVVSEFNPTSYSQTT